MEMGMLRSVRLAVALALLAGPALAQPKMLTVDARSDDWTGRWSREVER
jgi:hypothetical protein